MSTVTSAVTTCSPLQGLLENYFPNCAQLVRNIPMLQFLYSPMNRGNIEATVSPTFAKTRELILTYDQLIPTSEVTTISDCEGNCTATTKRGDLSQSYIMDCDGFMVEELFDPADWRQSCTSNYDKIANTILKMIAALDNKNSQNTVTEVSGLRGEWSSLVAGTTGDVLTVRTRVSSATTSAPMPTTWIDIQNAIMQTEYCREAFIVGGMDLYTYNQLMASGCCADTGVDLGDLFARYGIATAWDKHIQQAMGKEQNFVLMAGAVQLLTLNMNGESTQSELGYLDVGMGGGSDFAGVVESPWTGLPYDLTIRYDCRKIHIIMESRVKAVGMPIDMYPADDTQEGVTFVNQITVNNA